MNNWKYRIVVEEQEGKPIIYKPQEYRYTEVLNAICHECNNLYRYHDNIFSNGGGMLPSYYPCTTEEQAREVIKMRREQMGTTPLPKTTIIDIE